MSTNYLLKRTAVVGGLSRALQERIEMVWQILDPHRAARTRQELVLPHVSLQLVEGYLHPGQIHRLSRLATSLDPVSIELEGLDFFEAPRKVVFIRVRKSSELAAIQREMTATLMQMGFDSHPLYQPESWVPHISILLDAMRLEETSFLKALERRGYFSGNAELSRLLIFQNREEGRVQMDRRLGLPANRPPGRVTSYR